MRKLKEQHKAQISSLERGLDDMLCNHIGKLE